jgi:hypothetical protein
MVSIRTRYLLLLIPPLAQIMLAGFGGSGIILGTYYAGYCIVALFVLCIHRLSLIRMDRLPHWIPMELKSRALLYALMLFASLYGTFTYGPLGAVAIEWQRPNLIIEKNDLLSRIDPESPVAATYDLLPTVSSRRHVYLFPYAAIGKNQFALSDYPLPNDTRYLLIDWDDIVLMEMHVSSNRSFSPYANDVVNNMRHMLSDFSIVDAKHSILLLERSPDGDALGELLPDTEQPYAAQTGSSIELLREGDAVVLSVMLEPSTGEDDRYFIEIEADEELYRIPLGYSLIDHATVQAGGLFTMPLFIDTPAPAVKASLYRWTKGSISLTGIKTIRAESDAKLIAESHL